MPVDPGGMAAYGGMPPMQFGGLDPQTLAQVMLQAASGVQAQDHEQLQAGHMMALQAANPIMQAMQAMMLNPDMGGELAGTEQPMADEALPLG